MGFIYAETDWNLIKVPACHSLKQVVKQSVNLVWIFMNAIFNHVNILNRSL